MVDPAIKAKGTENVTKDDTWLFQILSQLALAIWTCDGVGSKRLKGELGVQVGPDSYILERALKVTAWGHRASPTQGTTSLMDLALLPSLSRVIACYPWLLGYWKFPEHMMLFQAFVIFPHILSGMLSLSSHTVYSRCFLFGIDRGAPCR